MIFTVDSLYGLKLFVTNLKTKLDLPTPVSPNNTTYETAIKEYDD